MGIVPVEMLRAVVAKLRIGVRLVHDDAFDEARVGNRQRPQSGLLHLRESLGIDLCVPSVVGIVLFQDGASRGRGIPAALDDYPVEVGGIAVVMRIALICDPTARLEARNAEGTRPQRHAVPFLAVRGRGGCADAVTELFFTDDGRSASDECKVGKRRRLNEVDLHGEVVQCLDRSDAVERAFRGASGLLVAAIEPGEDHVLSGDILPVGPL